MEIEIPENASVACFSVGLAGTSAPLMTLFRSFTDQNKVYALECASQ